MYAEYATALWGIWFIVCLIFVQGFIATLTHRQQAQYIPGVVDKTLGHSSFVFRSHRTHQNSLENALVFIVPALLGILTGMDNFWLAVQVWMYGLARLVHMVLYYRIATEKNPSPRSYFFMLGWLVNLLLLGMLAVQLHSL